MKSLPTCIRVSYVKCFKKKCSILNQNNVYDREMPIFREVFAFLSIQTYSARVVKGQTVDLTNIAAV